MHGLEITVVGMTLVFFTLGLVIVAMVLLTKLPWLQDRKPLQEQPEEQIEEMPAPKVVATTVDRTQEDELAQVAAIAVALLRARQRSTRRPQSKGKRSTWKTYGRAHQLGL
jgi:sodium pump decarboxylase gamma subunit